MNVFLIGELNDGNRILKDACADTGIVFESAGVISSDSQYLKVIETAVIYDNIILDLPYLKTAVADFVEGLTFLLQHYHGTVIIYAPNTDYTVETLKDYDYMVTDYGFVSSEQLPTDFYSNDIRIVVCGGNAEEVAAPTTLSHQLYRDESIVYIFSFIDPDDRQEVLDLMGDRREMVYFAPYTPDCFRSYADSEALLRELLGFREEQTAKPKRSFGRKRRR